MVGFASVRCSEDHTAQLGERNLGRSVNYVVLSTHNTRQKTQEIQMRRLQRMVRSQNEPKKSCFRIVKMHERTHRARWVDQGTAFCFGDFQDNEAPLIARAESDFSHVILTTTMRSTDVHQRQQGKFPSRPSMAFHHGMMREPFHHQKP